jgi:hypothetical protein
MDEFGENDGVMGNGVAPTLATGYYGKAVDFNGSSDYVVISDALPLGNSMTISFWSKLNSATDDEAFISKGAWGNTEAGSGGWYVRCKFNQYQFVTSKSGGYNSLSTFTNIPLSEWVHITVTIDQTTGYQRIYFNGV